MTKASSTAPAVTDHSMVMSVVARQPGAPASPAPAAAPAPEPVAPVLPEATVRIDYALTFLKSTRGIPKSKAVYLPESTHKALTNIIEATPDNVSMSDLLINVINHHFETFAPLIRQFVNTQTKAKNSNLPY